MNTDYQDIKYKALTEKIIKVFYKVYNELGFGFLEKSVAARIVAARLRDSIFLFSLVYFVKTYRGIYCFGDHRLTEQYGQK